MIMILSSVFGLLLVLGSARGQGGGCDTTALDACLSTFSTNSTNFLSNLIDSSNIDDGCSSFNQAKDCVSKANCKDEDASVVQKWLGARNAIQYICGDGKTDYLKYQPCFAGSSFTSAMTSRCLPYKNPIDNNMNPSDACMQLTSSLACAQSTAADVCEKDAGRVMREIVFRNRNPQVQNRAPGCSGTCDKAALDACLQPFLPSAPYFVLAMHNSSTIDTGCSMYRQTLDCIKQNTSCPDEDTLVKVNFLGLKRSIAYTCGDGKDDYLKAQACLSNGTLDLAKTTCPDQASDSSGSGPGTSTGSSVDSCTALNSQIACMLNVTRIGCGDDARDFMSNILPRFLAPAVQAGNASCIVAGSGGMKVAKSFILISVMSFLSLFHFLH